MHFLQQWQCHSALFLCAATLLQVSAGLREKSNRKEKPCRTKRGKREGLQLHNCPSALVADHCQTRLSQSLIDLYTVASEIQLSQPWLGKWCCTEDLSPMVWAFLYGLSAKGPATAAPQPRAAWKDPCAGGQRRKQTLV